MKVKDLIYRLSQLGLDKEIFLTKSGVCYPLNEPTKKYAFIDNIGRTWIAYKDDEKQKEVVVITSP